MPVCARVCVCVCGGGAYMQALTFYHANHPSSEAGSTLVCLRLSCPPETRTPFGQDQLTEVGHSIDGGIFQTLRGFVLSMCYTTDTTCEHAHD